MGVNEIFNNLCNHHEDEVVEFRRQRTTSTLTAR